MTSLILSSTMTNRLSHACGQNKTGGYGDKQKDQDTGGEGAVPGYLCFPGAGIGKIVNGPKPEAGGLVRMESHSSFPG